MMVLIASDFQLGNDGDEKSQAGVESLRLSKRPAVKCQALTLTYILLFTYK